MVAKKVTVAAAKKSHPLAGAVLRQLGGGADAVASAIDAANHGADGGFHGFTYTAETMAFFQRHRQAIMESAERMADDLGEDVLAMIGGFGCLKDSGLTQWQISKALSSHTKDIRDDAASVQNAMAWFALEEVGRAISDLQQQ